MLLPWHPWLHVSNMVIMHLEFWLTLKGGVEFLFTYCNSGNLVTFYIKNGKMLSHLNISLQKLNVALKCQALYSKSSWWQPLPLSYVLLHNIHAVLIWLFYLECGLAAETLFYLEDPPSHMLANICPAEVSLNLSIKLTHWNHNHAVISSPGLQFPLSTSYGRCWVSSVSRVCERPSGSSGRSADSDAAVRTPHQLHWMATMKINNP